jgi:hypothetical protein
MLRSMIIFCLSIACMLAPKAACALPETPQNIPSLSSISDHDLSKASLKDLQAEQALVNQQLAQIHLVGSNNFRLFLGVLFTSPVVFYKFYQLLNKSGLTIESSHLTLITRPTETISTLEQLYKNRVMIGIILLASALGITLFTKGYRKVNFFARELSAPNAHNLEASLMLKRNSVTRELEKRQ